MSAADWSFCGRRLDTGAGTRVMGILNVTPDSFSDGGRFSGVDDAVDAACRMVEAGADVIDIGGESTRPGAREVSPGEECERVLPVVSGIVSRVEAPVSIDTRHADVAREALAAGAVIVNDVSAMTHDEEMAGVVAGGGAGVVLMHMRGEPGTMQESPVYRDVVAEVAATLAERVESAVQAGIDRERIVVDPGIGFGKTLDHNLSLLAGLEVLGGLGRPILVGLSRKRFLGELTGRPVEERGAAGVAAHAFAILAGASILRVHDVMDTCDAVAIVDMLKRKRDG